MIDLVILTFSFKREIICFNNDLLGSFSVVPNFVLFTFLSENETKNQTICVIEAKLVQSNCLSRSLSV